MSKIVIGDGLSLPQDVVTSTLVVYGGKGMGKTNLGSVLVEELTKARLRWCTLDPLGVWWGLRHSKDGKGPGIECVILGGAHGDMPIEPTGGAVAADLVVDEPANVIIDFSRKPSGDMWGIGEKIRFVTEYAHRLFQRQGGLVDGRRREPIFQILDEAARYIPQQIPSGATDIAKCVGAWETLVEEGRNVGIGVGLLTQRSARMNKSVSEVADAMIAFRIVGPNSIAAVMDWMGEHVAKEKIKAHIETLRKLERGTCLVVSPGWLQFEGLATVRERETFDSSATPKPGERPRRVTGEGAKPDLHKYAERMKETIERAKAEDPKELKKRIAELQRQASAKGKPITDEGSITRAVERAVRERDAHWQTQLKQSAQATQKLINFCKKIAGEAANLGGIELPNIPVPAALPVQPIRTAPTPIAKPRTSAQSNGNDSMGKAQRKILSVLATHGPCSKRKLAILSGYAINGGAFNNPLGNARTNGWVSAAGVDPISITEEGLAALGGVDELPMGVELFDFWKNSPTLGHAEREILRVLRETADPLSKQEIAERTISNKGTPYEPEGGAFNNPLGRLRTLGLIEGYGQIQLCDELLEAV